MPFDIIVDSVNGSNVGILVEGGIRRASEIGVCDGLGWFVGLIEGSVVSVYHSKHQSIYRNAWNHAYISCFIHK